jgi:hypothetical protein
VVYHFKGHNEKDQYWRDISLEMVDDSTSNSVTDFLFKEHSYYFDSTLILQDQVKRLVQMILDKNAKAAKLEEAKAQAASKAKEVMASKNPLGKEKPKGASRIKAGIEQARELDTSSGSNKAVKKGELQPLKNEQMKKLDPIESKPIKNDDFDLLGFDDEKDTKSDLKKDSNEIEDNYDFDFEFDKPDPKDGSKIPPNDNVKPKENKLFEDIKHEVKPKNNKLFDNIKNEVKPKENKLLEDVKHEVKKSEDKGDDNEEDYIIIDGKRFREIQIEGEEDEFLMDDDGNIYDKEGQYIGTAKDGGEEEEEEDEK